MPLMVEAGSDCASLKPVTNCRTSPESDRDRLPRRVRGRRCLVPEQPASAPVVVGRGDRGELHRNRVTRCDQPVAAIRNIIGQHR